MQVSVTREPSFSAWISNNTAMLTKDHQRLLAIICWELWRHRNEKLWNNSSIPRAEQLVRNAKGFLKEWTDAKGLKFSPQQGLPEPNQKWTKPQPGLLKMNVDAAINIQEAAMGLGSVIRDEDGKFIAARGEQWKGLFAPREAEAIAIREALSWLKLHNIDNVHVESDSLQVVQSLNSNGGVYDFCNVFI
ncbi:PREDICTED: uncharacterized protein LOC109189292 [Ipomoea nil]|uniref:uncharacterized protein LOC109189292 n=1 Tax=Ipomoea nil TaxID=35883 RepID=UPI000901BE77|nr:PREDICTED: uncharacterized protein LOC109189292 [Ipomoea nil]